MSELLKTPLYDFHVSLGARMVPFAGYEMPVQYSGILLEHTAVRTAAGLFDVSHMGEAHITGPAAIELLDYLACNNISKIKPGKAIYSPLCNEDGGVVDDVIIYCLAENDFIVVLNASNKDKDIAWILSHANKFECKVVDESKDWALLALQGPKSFDILKECGVTTDFDTLTRFTLTTHPTDSLGIGPGEIIISRTGYTGEDGVELFVRTEQAAALAQLLLEKGSPHGMVPAGLGCRDSLRLEAGYPLYGHEITDIISPIEAGLGWTVKLKNTGDFIGKSVLTDQKENGAKRKMIHFVVNDKRIAREGTLVLSDGNQIGAVVSGAQSPIIGSPIGSALVESSCPTDGLSVEIRGKAFPIIVKTPPLNS